MLMTTGTIQIATLINNYELVTTELLNLLQSFDEKSLNHKPGPGRWSMAQVADHISLSNNSIARALLLRGQPVDRDPGERIDELKSIFLDFNERYEAPGFIVPTKDIYNPALLINEFQASVAEIMKRMYENTLDELINHPAFGNISKFEIMHFVLFHTQRHLKQVKEIIASL
ncbi:MAG: DinB family protein [Chitinophagaceae bacterium]|nr:DinB family protein [Chitinophagaceae bacterium]